METNTKNEGLNCPTNSSNTCHDDVDFDSLIFTKRHDERVKFIVLKTSNAIHRIKKFIEDDSRLPEVLEKAELLKLAVAPGLTSGERKNLVLETYKKQGHQGSEETLLEEANAKIQNVLFETLRIDDGIASLAIKVLRNPTKELTEKDAAILDVGGVPLFFFSIILGQRRSPPGFDNKWIEFTKAAMRGELPLWGNTSLSNEIDTYFEKWLSPYGVPASKGVIKQLIDTGFGRKEEVSFPLNETLDIALKNIKAGRYVLSNQDVETFYKNVSAVKKVLSPSLGWLLASRVLTPPSPMVGVNDFQETQAFRAGLEMRPTVLDSFRTKVRTANGSHSRIALVLLVLNADKSLLDDHFRSCAEGDIRILSEVISGRLRNSARKLSGLNIISRNLCAAVLASSKPTDVPHSGLEKNSYADLSISELEKIAMSISEVQKLIDPSLRYVGCGDALQNNNFKLLCRYHPLALGFSLWSISLVEEAPNYLRSAALEQLKKIQEFLKLNK